MFVSNQDKITQLDELHQELVEEPTKEEGWRGAYAWGFISYAEPHEFLPLLAQAQHWCYIKHDKDDKVAHYHILARFATEKSLSSCRKLQCGTQNLLGKPLNSIKAQMKMMAYLTHDTAKARQDGKHIYNPDDIVYKANDNYWEKQFEKEAEARDNEDKNEAFLKDLIDENMAIYEMARRYGRDFIKNFRSYMAFRAMFCKEIPKTEAEIAEIERKNDIAIDQAILDLEEIAESPSLVEIDRDITKIRIDKNNQKKGN